MALTTAVFGTTQVSANTKRVDVDKIVADAKKVNKAATNKVKEAEPIRQKIREELRLKAEEEARKAEEARLAEEARKAEEAKAKLKADALAANTRTAAGQEVYINYVGSLAKEIAKKHDLYGSVMVAQLLLESEYGRSGLSANYNNYFGIKGSYKGGSINLATNEDDGAGNLYTINDGFRVYSSIEESMTDYADLLNKPLYRGTRRSTTTSYVDATYALQGTYATDTSYAAKLQTMINRHNLTRFD